MDRKLVFTDTGNIIFTLHTLKLLLPVPATREKSDSLSFLGQVYNFQATYHNSKIHQIGAKDKTVFITRISAELCCHHCICCGVIVLRISCDSFGKLNSPKKKIKKYSGVFWILWSIYYICALAEINPRTFLIHFTHPTAMFQQLHWGTLSRLHNVSYQVMFLL